MIFVMFNEALKKVRSQLQKGKKVEKEHKGTIRKIKNSIKNNKIQLSDDEIYTNIAKDHLKELPDYYDRLKKIERNR